MKNKVIPSSFEVSLHGGLLPTSNPMVSKARLRAFYRGHNRNHSFISDDIANKLVAQMAYTPIVGFFEEETKDFVAHPDVRQSKPYGVVPFHSNFAWEKHVDEEDGIEREYATMDVYLFTGRYDEAKLIPGKKQSMELDRNTIKGSWETVGEREAFNYSEAVLSGLCILGDDATPCFEGSAFFSAHEDAVRSAKYFEELREIFSLVMGKETEEKGGSSEMDKTEVPVVAQTTTTATTADLVAAASGSATPHTHSYTVTTATPSFTGSLSPYVVCSPSTFSVVVNSADEVEAGKELLEKYGSFDAVEEKHEEDLAALTGKVEEFEVKLQERDTELAALKEQLAAYQEKEAEVEKARKEELIASYTTDLSAEELESVTAESDSLTYDEIEGRLSVLFTRRARKIDKVPNGHFELNIADSDKKILDLLSKYKKN